MSKTLDTLKNILGEIEGIEIEIVPAEEKKPEVKKATDFNSYFLNEVSKNKLGDISLPNQILAFQVYDKFRNVDVNKVNAEALFEDLKKIGQMPINRNDIEQRVAVVANNATTIACALDNYNPDIIDSMLRMEVVEVAVNQNMSDDVAKLGEIETLKNQEYVDTIFKSLFKSAAMVDFNRKIGDDK